MIYTFASHFCWKGKPFWSTNIFRIEIYVFVYVVRRLILQTFAIKKQIYCM